MTELSDLIGVFDKGGKPWCMRCWASKSTVSFRTVALGAPESIGLKCVGCKRFLVDSDRTTVPKVSIVLDAEKPQPCWPDLRTLDERGGKFIWIENPTLSFARLLRGTKSGGSTVSIRIDLPDGKTVVVAQTTMALFLMAADAFRSAEAGPNGPGGGK